MKKSVIIVLIIYAIIAAFTIAYFNGTGDSGDSITHYLAAKYAPQYPHLFFDHWNKPLFVLLACPFAQFGFTGMKVFNSLVVMLTILFTYLSAEKLKIKNPIIVAVILIFTPMYYILTFSGLTEPLFALLISIALFLSLKNKHFAAALIISFLPFVRSEGLIIIGVFGLYYLFKRNLKAIPSLLIGSVIYSVAGYFVHHDILWVFTKIPYSRLSSTYGSGELFDFVGQLFYVTGFPIFAIFCIGLIAIIYKNFRIEITSEINILIIAGFFCFFIAHSLFWYFGIFNSMGLKRVLLCVMPQIAIISAIGFNFIGEIIPSKYKIIRISILSIVITYITVFPFTGNPSAVFWDKEMNLNSDQKAALKIADFIKESKVKHRFIFSHPYLCIALNVDWFDKTQWIDFTPENIIKIKDNDIIIWENWFATVENGIAKDILDKNPKLSEIFSIKDNDEGREMVYAVYMKKEITLEDSVR